MNQNIRRISFIILCVIPFLNFVVVGARPLRIPGVYQIVGAVLLVVILLSAWNLGLHAIASKTPQKRLALTGALFVIPTAIVSFLWVGLGAPFQATLAENYMRFVVLLADSMIVASAFIALKEELYDAGENFYSTIGFAAGIFAGVTYVACMSIAVASCVIRINGGENPYPTFMNDLFDVLEFFACVLTYLATASYATSLGQLRWLSRRAALAYVAVSACMLLLLMLRGLSYPEISNNTQPWYTQPGVIAGIPAVPWLMPYLLGVVLLRRVGYGDSKMAGERASE